MEALPVVALEQYVVNSLYRFNQIFWPAQKIASFIYTPYN